MLLLGEAMLYLTSCMLSIQIIITNYWHQHFLLAFSLYQHIGISETVAWTSHQQKLHNFFSFFLPLLFLFPFPLSFLLFFLSWLPVCPSVCLFWQNLAIWLRQACHSYGIPRLQKCTSTPSRGLWFSKTDISSAFLCDSEAASFTMDFSNSL